MREAHGPINPFTRVNLFAMPVKTVLLAALVSFLVTGCDFTGGQLETALCSNGIAVTDPHENSDLVGDCVTLLGVREEPAGEVSLSWSAQIPMEEWEGVSFETEGATLRVTEVRLDGRGLTGKLSSSLGSLSSLVGLWLHGNRLSGENSGRTWQAGQS